MNKITLKKRTIVLTIFLILSQSPVYEAVANSRNIEFNRNPLLQLTKRFNLKRKFYRPEILYLSDMVVERSERIHGGLGIDRPYWTDRLIIGGIYFRKGLVIHPLDDHSTAFVEYRLNGQFNEFRASIGWAYEKTTACNGSRSRTMRYNVKGDSRSLMSGDFHRKQINEIFLSISGVKVLRLEVDDAGDTNHCDHAAWGDARVIRYR